MMSLLFPLVLLACVAGVLSAGCDICTSSYETDKAAGTPTDATKCAALKTYFHCLEDATGTGCPLATAEAATIVTDFDALTAGTCTLNPLCTCQKTYWATDVTIAADKCTAVEKRVGCLIGKTGTGCEATDTLSTLSTKTATLITDAGSCTSTTPTCDCEKVYVSSAQTCTDGNTLVTCLTTAAAPTQLACDAVTTNALLTVEVTLIKNALCASAGTSAPAVFLISMLLAAGMLTSL